MKIKLPGRLDWAGRKSNKEPGLAYDCELAARIREGDRAALKQLVDRHSAHIHTYLLHRLGEGHSEAMDKILASTFRDALKMIGPYASGRASTPMDHWLIRLAERNLERVRLKAAKEVAGATSDLDRFRAALLELPQRQRFVLALAVFEQMPAREIAMSMGITTASAMRRLRSALKRVEKALQKQEEER